jgi:NhaA family Na+:H+ antiporter
MVIQKLIRPFAHFFRLEAAAGIVLLLSAALALLLANTDWGVARYFPAVWETHLHVPLPGLVLNKSLLHWINDGLMTVFFLVVGLEIKREVLHGELASWQQAALPIAGALGGMVVPALLFAAFNHGTSTAGGWGIPMATDIAFALAVLQLLGPRIPLGLKVFLTALAIVDDLGAVVVIAGFYTRELHLSFLYLALGTWGVLLGLNALGVRHLGLYLPLGAVLWFFMLQSGIHATLAGVLLALAIPTHSSSPSASHEAARLSPAQVLEQRLHGIVAFGVMPLFAFANTSLVLDASVRGQLASPLALGILVGLVVGKPLGIGLLSWGTVRLGWAALPAGVSWPQLWGVACLGGIGFTMSLLITLLALGEHSAGENVAKLAILLASLVAGVVGYLVLRAMPAPAAAEEV